MKQVYIVGGNGQYRALFSSLGFEIVNSKNDADLVCFTGGEDVSPELYGDKEHEATWSNYARDVKEREIFGYCERYDIPMVGICRGGQFLNVMNGGRMYQHVTKHAVSDGHDLIDVASGRHVHVSSTHHQMFMPGPDAEIVAIATLGGSREWYEGQVFKRDISNTDYEVLYYAKTNSLCFQPHPEFTGAQYEGMREYFTECLERIVEIA